MWKIMNLHLVNFAHILSGMQRSEITLDLSANNNVINLIIGKMGSGKTAILGQLQPFSSYGTLDIRNQKPIIIPNENGLKEISYQRGDDLIEIQHHYNWNKHVGTHNVKSYIQLNGVELNPNGNSSSFKELIKIHFGIEQDFLRLLRLGPNVANLIGMKASERKSFIASLLSESEVYISLYKHLTDDLRNINASLSVLSKKLVSLSSTEEDSLRKNLQELLEDISAGEKNCNEIKNEYFRQQGLLTAILSGRTLTELETEYSNTKSKIEETKIRLREIQESLSRVPISRSLPDLMRDLGATEMQKEAVDQQVTQLDEAMKKTRLELSKLEEMRTLRGSKDHMEDLKRAVHALEEKYEAHKKRLVGFTYQGSYRFLSSFIDSLSVFNIRIDEMVDYPVDLLSELYYADKSIITKSKKRIDRIQGRLFMLQKQVNNIRFAATYEPPYPLIRPPFCPTETCPYIQTHPAIIRDISDNSKTGPDSPLAKLMDEIDKLNIAVMRYRDIPELYQKMLNLKDGWAQIRPILIELGAIKSESLYHILITPAFRNNWYDRGKLVDVLELCKIREEFYNLEVQVKGAKQELQTLEDELGGDVDAQIEMLQERKTRETLEFERLSEETRRHSSAIRELQELCGLVEKRDDYQAQETELSLQLEALRTKRETMKHEVTQAHAISNALSRFDMKIKECESSLGTMRNKAEKLRVNLNDIKFTKKEFGEAAVARDELRYIQEACSTKDGIPLLLVKVFLEDCREILNDLIANIFADSLEILEFDISGSEFKIPYAVNDNEIDDISAASQGQQAVISIALSFALVQKSMFDYNIMLLDEVDGPLYKKDREKFLAILFKQLQAIGASQVFLISHNNTFENIPMNVIMTTPEIVDEGANREIIRLY